MPKVIDKLICDGGRSIVVYVAGRQKDSWMKKLRLITLSEYRVPKGAPGLMSDDGVAVDVSKLRMALVDGTLFNGRDLGRRNVLKVGARTWDIGNRGI